MTLTAEPGTVLTAAAKELPPGAAALAQMHVHGVGRRERDQPGAVDDNRGRLARELHDLLGHRLLVISLQARQVRSTDEHTRRAVEMIDDLARLTGQDLRRILGLLRTDDEDTADRAALVSADVAAAAKYLPSDLVSVFIENAERERPVLLAVREAVLRVVQECVTNAIKHGGGRVHVELSFGDDLVLSVVNEVAATDEQRPVASTSGRRGLPGLADRLAEHGGSLAYGGDACGRFRVRATLPMPTADDAYATPR